MSWKVMHLVSRISPVASHTAFTWFPANACARLGMQSSLADSLWATMTQGKYFSTRDLANLTDQPRGTAADVLQFLTKYGFVNRIGANDPVFTKSPVNFSPGESINILRRIAKLRNRDIDILGPSS